MAYVSKEDKAEITNKINPLLKKWGLKGTLSVNHNSTLTLTIWAGKIDFIGDSDISEDYIQVNEYYYKDHFVGNSLECLSEIIPAMYTDDWYCTDDIQSDYFDRKYYIYVRIGTWEKPYKFTSGKTMNSENKDMVEIVEETPNPYQNASIKEIFQALMGMGEVISTTETLAKTMDVSSVCKQLADMMENISKEIEFRMTTVSKV